MSSDVIFLTGCGWPGRGRVAGEARQAVETEAAARQRPSSLPSAGLRLPRVAHEGLLPATRHGALI